MLSGSGRVLSLYLAVTNYQSSYHEINDWEDKTNSKNLKIRPERSWLSHLYSTKHYSHCVGGGGGERQLDRWWFVFSTGRNVAQYEETHQSSWKTPTMAGAPSNSYLPDNAVDGQTGTSNLNLLSTCTHTATGESPHWWSVTFSHPMDIMWVLIYNTYGKKFMRTHLCTPYGHHVGPHLQHMR